MLNYRKTLFNIKELLFNGSIVKHYKNVCKFYSQKLSNKEQLENLLSHAVSNVPHYLKHDAKSLTNFPVVNKLIIKTNLSSFQAKNYIDRKFVTLTTSGSTGTPFTVFQDLNKKSRNLADTLYFSEIAGYELGNKLYYFKIWAKQKMSNPILYKIQNIIPVDVLDFDEDKIKQIIQEIQSSKQKISILGYVSSLEQFIRYSQKKNIDFIKANIVSVITMSEGLSKETKSKLEMIFRCAVVSRYSNLENGIIAQQELNSDLFFVNSASYVIEIFDPNKDELLSLGKYGRIVVTDLYNMAMPLIRYDTGDYGKLIQKNGIIYLEAIEGRKLDLLYNTKGQLISSYIAYKNMWQYIEIDQYQLIQNGIKDYVFKINAPNGFERHDKMIEEFRTYLGHDANIEILTVDEIPLLSSGKRRKVIQKYYI